MTWLTREGFSVRGDEGAQTPFARIPEMRFVVLLVLVLSGGCHSTTIKAEFTPVGAIGRKSKAKRMVPKAADVQVFFASSPPGFSLRENELTVESGHKHKILGMLTLRTGKHGNLSCSLTQHDAVVALQQKAYQIGANAVVYATSPLSQSADEVACANAETAASFGSGWAVVLGREPDA